MPHRILAALFLSLLLIPTTPLAQEKPLRNSIGKQVKLEKLSHRASYRFSRVKSPTRRGKKAQRFEIRHGDCGKTTGWNDCLNDRARVEMKEQPKNSISKPGQGVWYGYSIFIPKDFVSLGRGNTMLGQVKAEGWGLPMWSLTFNDAPYLNFPDEKKCRLGSLTSWQGRWIDITIYAHYGHSGQSRYFELYKDGALLCSRTTPFMPAEFLDKTPKLGLKYGIYNSYVSRYLAKVGTLPAVAEAFAEQHKTGTSKSPSKTPFEFDWGVELPTHIVYYDEMRAGKTRADVDVKMLEERGVPPVD